VTCQLGTFMSVKRSQSDSTKDTKVSGTLNNPVTLFGKILTRTNHKALVDKLVSHLQKPDYSVVDFLHDAAETKKKFVSAGMPVRRLVDSWTRLDRTVEDCLAVAVVPHEKFIDNTLHAFCELDQSGFITFANAKMIEWAPGCVGRELATLFGKMANEVRKALAAKGPRRLHQFELEGREKRYTILVEFGTIDAEGPTSGYALLVDMSELVDAEHKALEAAPNGMLKIDSKYRVLYANKIALDLFELRPEELIGRDPRDFISGQVSRREVARQSQERRSGRGGQYDALFRRPKTRETINVRITSIPYFNTSGEFSGALTSFQPIDREIARKNIAGLVATQTNYQGLFADILKIIKPFIPFDWADLSLYTKERDYAFSFCRYPVPKPGEAYKIKWWPVPLKYQGFIDQPFPYIPDMEAFLSQTPEGRQELEKPEMQSALAEGRKALLAFPVRRGGRIIGALSLQSKEVGRYSEDMYRVLRDDLAVDQALQAVFNLRESANRDFVFDLLKEISAATDHQQLAETIVGEFARFYDFQNVSIFKINAWRGCFSLLAQRLGPQGGARIPNDYMQSLKDGLLGLTYERGESVHLKDIDDGSEEAKRFLKVDGETKSELCIPIQLRGRILWILNFEDSRKHAFADPEIEKIEGIVKQVDAAVDRLFQGLVLAQVLKEFPDGIVIAGKEGNVFLCNDDAQRLFETESDPSGAKLSSFLSKSDLTVALSEQASPTWRTEVSGLKGKKTTVLMSKFLLPEEYDHVVLRLQDVTELQWKADVERLRAALAEATSQVRVPLSLVSSYVQQIGRKAGNDGDLIDLVGKTIRQLSRIELTYDRIFASYDVNKLPPERKVPVNVNRVIDHILNQLPAGDRRIVKFAATEEPGSVWADTYRLLFALESMLTYLLRSRADSNEINLNIANRNKKCIDIIMDGSVAPREIGGELDELVEATRMEIALGERLLKRIAAESGGTFTRQQLPGGREQLTLRLKVTPS
jgi:PAS domain S-box-containing protein